MLRSPFAFVTLLLTGVLASTPSAAAQQPGGLDLVRELVERARRAVAARPPAFDDELVTAITAALKAPGLAGRCEPEVLDRVVTLAEFAVAAGRAEPAIGWLRPFDASLASAAEPAVRHRLAPVLGLALRSATQVEAARARLQPACDELVARAPATDALLQDVRRQLAAALATLLRWQECLPLALAVVEGDRATQVGTPQFVDDLRCVGRAYHGLGRRQEAYDTFVQALQLARSDLPRDDVRVLTAMADLAAATGQLGDYRGAYEIYRESIAMHEAAAVPDQGQILHLKQQLSQVLVQLDNIEEACALQEEVLVALAAASPRDELTYALGLLYYARNLFLLRRLDESYEAALDALRHLQALVPDDHRDLGNTRALLGVLERRRGDFAASRSYLEAAYSSLLKSQGPDHSFTQNACGDLLSTCRLQDDVARAADLAAAMLDASIAAVQRTSLASRQTARLVSIHGKGVDHALSIALDPVDPALVEPLVRRALVVTQYLRGASAHAGRVTRRGQDEPGKRLAGLEAVIAGVVRTSDDSRLAALVREKEALERAVLATTRLPLPDPAAMARALPEGAVAAATVQINRRLIRAPGADPLSAVESFVAIVLSRDGSVRAVDLGGRDDLLDLVDAFAAAPNNTALAKKLRSRVVDPIRAAAPAARRLYLALDDILLSVPWDSLPLASGAMVASELEVRRLTSLVDLVPAMAPAAPPAAGAARLLVVGDVAFGAPAAPDAAAFAPLPQSADEVAAVERAFHRAFPDAPVARLLRDAVTKEAVRAAVPGASVVHFATHGGLDTATIQARVAAVGGGEVTSTAFELAPFALSGLALAGANRGVDPDGLVPGYVTAAELQRFDFGTCYLAVVSACDSAVGAASSGQGLASLQEALHIAGARHVLAALWPVSDAGARHFVAAFHEALWRDPSHPYLALRAAKEAAARAGLPFADWAAFQLTGH